MINASLTELSRALASKDISSLELTTLFIDRALRLNPALNAFVTLSPELSLAQAQAADLRIAKGTHNR